MTRLEVDNEEKPFLFSSIKFVKWYKTFTKKSLSIGAIILIIILYIMSNYQTLFLLILKLFYKDKFLDNFEYAFDEGSLTYLHGIYFLFDIPFAVLIVNIITFGLFQFIIIMFFIYNIQIKIRFTFLFSSINKRLL